MGGPPAPTCDFVGLGQPHRRCGATRMADHDRVGPHPQLPAHEGQPHSLSRRHGVGHVPGPTVAQHSEIGCVLMTAARKHDAAMRATRALNSCKPRVPRCPRRTSVRMLSLAVCGDAAAAIHTWGRWTRTAGAACTLRLCCSRRRAAQQRTSIRLTERKHIGTPATTHQLAANTLPAPLPGTMTTRTGIAAQGCRNVAALSPCPFRE